MRSGWPPGHDHLGRSFLGPPRASSHFEPSAEPVTRGKHECAESAPIRPRPMSTQAPVRKLELGRVGESVQRVDGIPKVTGEFAYASDLYAAGMLWGHTLRSPHAHARIVSIDVSQAMTMPGVHAVLTHEDIPGRKHYGLVVPDQPVLASERVRY